MRGNLRILIVCALVVMAAGMPERHRRVEAAPTVASTFVAVYASGAISPAIEWQGWNS